MFTLVNMATELRFVVHRHDASRLHYDFRLELDGVLKSWAVPKGPSYNTGEKRLAVQVEDHRLSYADFEGVIPEGQYGAGDVSIWDAGTWEAQGDAREGLERGRLTFTLRGRKLAGAWTLLRMRDKNWLLKKKAHDAAPARDVEPQLCRLVESVPDGDGWLFETKFDGYRAIARKAKHGASLASRSAQDWTQTYGGITDSVRALPCEDAILDGEIVALRADGHSDFQALQNARGELVYYAFDLLALDGQDLRSEPLATRKVKLKKLLKNSNIRFSAHTTGDGEQCFAKACKDGLEGIIAKRSDAPYKGGRGADWLKIKCSKRQEFVIGGYTDPKGAREGFGSLLLGTYAADGTLKYAGHVGTGFTRASLAQIRSALRKHARKASPFVDGPTRGNPHWVKPALIAEVAFTEWTSDGRLRHPTFKGLRIDKPASDVHRDKAQSVTHPERELWPRVTKQDLADYYAAIAPFMLPYVSERPLSVVRCPRGQKDGCFFQRHVVTKSAAVHAGRDFNFIRDAAGLLALAQLSTLEVHTWGSLATAAAQPDLLVFDLDPGESVTPKALVAATTQVRDFLNELGLQSWLKHTGGKGVHLVVPIKADVTWRAAKAFCKGVATALEQKAPGTFVARADKAARKGRVYIDYLRNSRGSSSIAPYSTRARDGAPVARPLAWTDLTPAVLSKPWNVQDMRRALGKSYKDPWAGLRGKAQALQPAVAALKKRR